MAFSQIVLSAADVRARWGGQVLKASPNAKERSAVDAMEDAKKSKQDQMEAMRKLDQTLQNSDEVMEALNMALKEAAAVSDAARDVVTRIPMQADFAREVLRGKSARSNVSWVCR